MLELSSYDQKFLERLQRHPHLRERLESMLCIAEDADGDLVKADEAERRIIEEVRKMGNELLTEWAQSRIEKQASTVQTGEKRVRAGQKKRIGTARLAE